jgi:hypothetical protein
MLACGCMNPIDIMATLAGYGFLGITVLFIGLICLVGLLLGGMAAVGHLVRGQQDDGLPSQGEADPDEEATGLASFRWEAEQD